MIQLQFIQFCNIFKKIYKFEMQSGRVRWRVRERKTDLEFSLTECLKQPGLDQANV